MPHYTDTIHHFFSDPHFGHERIIGYCQRPFQSAQEMNQTLIQRYNERVSPDETTLWCGDAFLTLTVEEMCAILDSLNGKKILTLGNHDQKVPAVLKERFLLVAKEVTFALERYLCRGNHYPYRRPGGPLKHLTPAGEDFLIHGHIHGTSRRNGNMIHVGVDAWDYRPVSAAEVLSLIGEENDSTRHW